MQPSVILITGTSSGIGHVSARELAREGHAVVATMRDPDGRNRDVRDALTREHANLSVRAMDLRDGDSVERAVADTLATHGRIDAVIQNAGSLFLGVTEAFTVEQLQRQMDVNLTGAFRVARAVLPSMRARESGLLVHVSSAFGRVAVPFNGLYCASKFALEGMVEAMHHELRPFGIDCVLVEPGPFATAVGASAVAPDDTARLKEYARLDPMGARLGATFGRIFSTQPAETDPVHVARAFSEIIALPAGKRPLRTLVGLDTGVRRLNEAHVTVMRSTLKALDLEAPTGDDSSS